MNLDKICPHCMQQINDEVICSNCKKNPREISEASHYLRPFTIIQGRYLVGNVLDEGNIEISYIGLDINTRNLIVIKEFYPKGFVCRESEVTTTVTVSSDVDMNIIKKWKNNYLTEANGLARCEKISSIAGVKDILCENDTVYIVQEYLEGERLSKYILSRGGRISADELIRLMHPVIRALNEVHIQGVLHRDICPDNIMILKNGTMKLFNFGTVIRLPEENGKGNSTLLKAGYAPEEQYDLKAKLGPWTDVYALCATMYKCITGAALLESPKRLQDDTLKWPTEMGIPVSKRFEEVLKKGMAVRAENRILNMQELYDAIYKDNIGDEIDRRLSERAVSAQMVSPMMGNSAPFISTPCSWENGKKKNENLFGKIFHRKKLELKKVEFTVIAPKIIKKEEHSIVNVVMYEEAFRYIVEEIKKKFSDSVLEENSGIFEVESDSKVKICLTSPDLLMEDNEEVRVWKEGYLNFSFSVFVPKEYNKNKIFFQANVYINELIVTKLKFVVNCFSLFEQKIKIRREDVLSAFVSYASQDRARVATLIQGMKKINSEMDIFFDVESLRSGQDWEKILYGEIEKRDVLFLCWSSHAKRSRYVEAEWRYALEHKGEEGIEPIPIEPPNLCPPPVELSKKHFNDKLLNYINNG